MSEEIKNKAVELNDAQMDAVSGGGTHIAGPCTYTCSKCDDYSFGIYFNKDWNNGCPYYKKNKMNTHGCYECLNFSE